MKNLKLENEILEEKIIYLKSEMKHFYRELYSENELLKNEIRALKKELAKKGK